MIINRNFARTENDDFKLHVEHHLTEETEAVPIYHDGYIIAWKIQSRYE